VKEIIILSHTAHSCNNECYVLIAQLFFYSHHYRKHSQHIHCCFQLSRSDWQTVIDPVKDVWKSTTTVNGEPSVVTTTSMIVMRQLLVFNWDLGKIGVNDSSKIQLIIC